MEPNTFIVGAYATSPNLYGAEHPDEGIAYDAEQEARLQQVQHHQSKMAKFRSEEEEDMAEATAMEAHDTAMRPFYDQCKEMRRQLRAEGEYNDAEWGSPSSSVAGDGPEQHNGDPIMHAT